MQTLAVGQIPFIRSYSSFFIAYFTTMSATQTRPGPTPLQMMREGKYGTEEHINGSGLGTAQTLF
jgi:hypothetical protein